MFKVSISQIDRSQEEEILIKCHDIDDEVISIMNKLKREDNLLIGTKDGEIFRTNIKDVYYIEAVDSKCFIYTKGEVYESKSKLYELEELTADTKLFRCSKSMIVNISKIRSVAPSLSGRLEAKLLNGESVVISRQYVPELKKKLGL